jgi:LAO/AO transport system kinase
LARLERAPDEEATVALLDSAYRCPRAQVLGVTGPPGVGKSTLVGALIANLRRRGRTIGVIAVDPSSRISGGALLGDRIRIQADPGDPGVFIRSMAARDRMGGLAALTVSATALMRALFDIVIVETVGVGQSETDVSSIADTVVLCIQPASGDTVQFMKAGAVEIPHIMVVNKSDLGEPAVRTHADATAAVGMVERPTQWLVPVLTVSASRREGIDALASAVDEHWKWLGTENRLETTRRHQAESWVADALRQRYAREGMARAGEFIAGWGDSPFRAITRAAISLQHPSGTRR